jgi:hypothetical protein
VRWQTVDVPGDPTVATKGVDYVAASGTLVFPVGATRQIVNIAVRGDGIDEPNETVLVALSNPVNATLGPTPGRGVIRDDD